MKSVQGYVALEKPWGVAAAGAGAGPLRGREVWGGDWRWVGWRLATAVACGDADANSGFGGLVGSLALDVSDVLGLRAAFDVCQSGSWSGCASV